MELWEHFRFVYYKCQCILNYVYFLLYEYFLLFCLIEHHVLQEIVVWELVLGFPLECIEHMTTKLCH